MDPFPNSSEALSAFLLASGWRAAGLEIEVHFETDLIAFYSDFLSGDRRCLCPEMSYTSIVTTTRDEQI